LRVCHPVSSKKYPADIRLDPKLKVFSRKIETLIITHLSQFKKKECDQFYKRLKRLSPTTNIRFDDRFCHNVICFAKNALKDEIKKLEEISTVFYKQGTIDQIKWIAQKTEKLKKLSIQGYDLSVPFVKVSRFI